MIDKLGRMDNRWFMGLIIPVIFGLCGWFHVCYSVGPASVLGLVASTLWYMIHPKDTFWNARGRAVLFMFVMIAGIPVQGIAKLLGW